MNDPDLEDLPGSDPLCGKKVMKRECNIQSDATLFRGIRKGRIPKPDGTVGGANVWRWSTIKRTREALLNT